MTVRVVKVAMIKTKQGSLATSGICRRNSEIMRLEPTNTKPLASARPKPLTTLLLTASNGHKPSSCAQAGLLLSTPRLNVLKTGCSYWVVRLSRKSCYASLRLIIGQRFVLRGVVRCE